MVPARSAEAEAENPHPIPATTTAEMETTRRRKPHGGEAATTYCCLVGKTVPERDRASRDEVSFQILENTFSCTMDTARKSRPEEAPQENDLIPSRNTL